MRRIFSLCALLFFLCTQVCLGAQILPMTEANWKAKSAPQQISASNISQVAGDASAALEEYGLKSAEKCVYGRGGATFTVIVYTFADPSGAYGAYSFLRTPDMAQAKLAQHSSMSANRALALTGNLVVQFAGDDLRRAYNAMDLMVAAAGGHALFGIYPPLPQRLPVQDFVPRSDHYVLGPVALGKFLPLGSGDWLGFSKGAEAELGHYRLDGRESTLLIADYPTPQIAQERMSELQKQLGVVDADNAATKPGGVDAVYAHRDGTMIALVSGAQSQASANSLLQQIHMGLAVTWNAPVLKKNQPSMATIVVGTIVGAGEICVFTLLGGVVFAGLRLTIKRMLPGRVFDRTRSLEILELGLSSRRVKPNDLYQIRG